MTHTSRLFGQTHGLPQFSSSVSKLLNGIVPGIKRSDTRTLRSVGWSVLGTGADYLGSFVLTLLVARPLGPVIYGQVALVMGIVEIPRFIALTTLGTSMAKHLSSLPRGELTPLKQLMRAGMYLTVSFSTVMALLMYLLADFAAAAYNMPELAVLLRIGAVIVFASGVVSFVQSVFQGMDRLDLLSKSQLANIGSRVALTIILVYALRLRADGVLLGTAVAALGSAAVFLVVTWRVWWRGVRNAGRLPIMRIVSYALPMLAGSVAFFAYTRIDVLILAYFAQDSAELGYLGIAAAVLAAVLAPANAVGSASFPKVATLAARQEPQELQHLFDLFAHGLFLYAVPTCIAMYTLAEGLFDMFLPAYRPAAVLVQILSPLVILRSLGILCCNGYLTPSGRAGDVARLTVVSAIANVIVDFILIPPLGAKGSVIGTLVVHGASSLAAMELVRRNLNVRFKIPWRMVVGGLAMVLAIGTAQFISSGTGLAYMSGFVLLGVLSFVSVIVLGRQIADLGLERMGRKGD
jgi:O-antigen/teichoic acid export membrane protein